SSTFRARPLCGPSRRRAGLVQNRNVSIVASVDDEPWPPNRISVPSGSRFAAWLARGEVSTGAVDHEFDAGVNTSTMSIGTVASSVPCAPPQTTTRPSASRVALCSARAFGMLYAAQVFVVGL